MNKLEKHGADWVDIGANIAKTVRDAVVPFFSNAASGARDAVINTARYGTVAPTPSMQRAYADSAAADKAAAKTKADIEAKQLGADALKFTLAGLGGGLVLTRLHHLLSGVNKPEKKYTKFAPGPQDLDADEKVAAAAPQQPDFLTRILSAPGQLIQKLPHKEDQDAAKYIMFLGGSGLGLYGGYSIMQQLAERKRKEETQAMIDNAKKDYQRALTGRKTAADLDAAFANLQKTASETPVAQKALLAALDAAFLPIRKTGLMPLYGVGAVAAPGVLAGKMVYDWTRERGKDKALAEARKYRARLAANERPVYIDPEQLAKVKAIAD